MTVDDKVTLYILGDRGRTVDGSANDVRGSEVKDKDGHGIGIGIGIGIGKVADLVVDDREIKVRFLLVEHGGFLGFGEKKTLIPVDVVTKVTENEVFGEPVARPGRVGARLRAASHRGPAVPLQHLRPLRVRAVLGRRLPVSEASPLMSGVPRDR